MLYIVSTPIGNLSDITLRALDILKTVDAVLCEDTRVSKILLTAHGIHTPLISYHSFNEKQRVDDIIHRLKNGESFALISDAGTPLFQDPGFILLQACHKENIPYTTVPGASSILSALILSGFNIQKFQFIGFLSKKTSEAKASLAAVNEYLGLSVFFESPRRVVETLQLLEAINPNLSLCVIREMTKKFETVHKGTPGSLIEEFTLTPPRGEIVFVVEGLSKPVVTDYTDLAFELITQGMSKKSAYSLLSKIGFVDKDLIYKS